MLTKVQCPSLKKPDHRPARRCLRSFFAFRLYFPCLLLLWHQRATWIVHLRWIFLTCLSLFLEEEMVSSTIGEKLHKSGTVAVLAWPDGLLLELSRSDILSLLSCWWLAPISMIAAILSCNVLCCFWFWHCWCSTSPEEALPPRHGCTSLFHISLVSWSLEVNWNGPHLLIGLLYCDL